MLSLLVTGTQALASTGGASDPGMGNFATLLVVFGGLIILLQFTPGITLFMAIVRWIFSREIGTPSAAVEAAWSNR